MINSLFWQRSESDFEEIKQGNRALCDTMRLQLEGTFYCEKTLAQ